MDKEKKGTNLATEHVDWFLSTIRPLLISHFEHGYKHGVEFIDESEPVFSEQAKRELQKLYGSEEWNPQVGRKNQEGDET